MLTQSEYTAAPVQDIQAHVGVEAPFHSFIPLVLHENQWLASHPSCFTPRTDPSVLIEYTAELAPQLE